MAQNVIWIDFNRIKIFISEDIDIRGLQLKGNSTWDDSITIPDGLLTTPTIERKKGDIIYIGNLNEDTPINITQNEMTVICNFNNNELTEILNEINETIVVDTDGNDITNRFAFNTFIEPLGIHYHLIEKSKDGNGNIRSHKVLASDISKFNTKFNKDININLIETSVLNFFFLLEKSTDSNGNIRSHTVLASDISKFNTKFDNLL